VVNCDGRWLALRFEARVRIAHGLSHSRRWSESCLTTARLVNERAAFRRGGGVIVRLKWIVGVVGLIFLAGPMRSEAESKPERIYRKALPSVMTLEVENQAGERFVGSGVLALEDDIAITAWHVVCDAQTVWATFADGQRVRVIGCIDKDNERDLALLKLDRKLSHRRAVLCQRLQSVAAPAYVIGAPKGYGFSISDGLISQIRRVDGFPQYQVSCPISPGNSGGPVLNERGEVIGIASWTKSDAQNVSFAIPVGELAKLNASSCPTSWEQLALLPRPPLAARAVEPFHPVSSAQNKEKTAGSLEELKKQLENSVGKSVTVIVQEGGQETKFTFTVPHTGWK